jgi:hypothetical protein
MRLMHLRLAGPFVPAGSWTAPRAWRRLPTQRGAAIAVALGFLLFFAAQIGLGWAIDTERNPLRDPIYFDKLAILRRHPAFFAAGSDRPTTVLFIGSSRTLNAIDARAAARQLSGAFGRPMEAFNFGQAGAGPVTNAVYLRRLVREGVKPDFAVIEVHPTFLAGNRLDPPETRWLLPLRLRPEEMPIVRAMGFPAADPTIHGARGYLAPWYECRFLLLDRYAPFLLMNNQRLNGGHEPDEYGFTRLANHVDAKARKSLLKLAFGQYAYYFQGYRPNGCGLGAIRDTLDVCRAAGIQPALILMPESSEWRGWYDPVGYRELDDVVAGLAAEYGVPAFDGRRWVPDDLSIDGHHLTGLGADRFTRALVGNALVPWIARSRTSP